MISQIDLIGKILKCIEKQGVKHIVPRQYNTIVRCVNEILEVIRSPIVMATPGMGLDAWLKSDDTGSASLFMASVLTKRFNREFAYPHDPEDLGRCIRLLDAAPDLRAEIPSLKDFGPEWSGLANHWDELEALYREELPSGNAPKTFERMKEVMGHSRKVGYCPSF